MKYLIVLSSITYALKAQELLKSNGIYAKITRSKAVKNIRGCGHGLVFDSVLAEKANQLLSEANIPIIGSTEEK